MQNLNEKGTILCYGDSNTWGYDTRSYLGERYPEQVRWTGILKRESGFEILNLGLNGRTIPQFGYEIKRMNALLDRTEDMKSPVWLWIMLGGNDLMMIPDSTAETVAERMRKFLKQILVHPAVSNDLVNIRLIAPPAVKQGTWITEERVLREASRLGETYGKLAMEEYLDFTDASILDLPVLFDGVHLSEEGHRKLAEYLLYMPEIYETIQKDL